MGRVTGEMKGGMEKVKSLYLKGLAPSDGRDGAFFNNNRLLIINNARLILNNAAFVFRQPSCTSNVPLLGSIYSQPGNKTFPPWESASPSLLTVTLPVK